jgi:3-deoxy-manno-octulosonate cytidylyltransferase (CMP-KDO synthetase)
MPVLGVIPARMGSTRLPHKPLLSLGGEPLVVRVWQRARGMVDLDEVVVATDASEIVLAVERAGGRAVLTSGAHESGTERVAEVANRAEFAGYQVIVNVQGDEPFLPREAVTGAVERVNQGYDVGTAAVPLEPKDVADPARVKVVTDDRGGALYFSRSAIPFLRDPDSEGAAGLFWQHLGVYAYGRSALNRWVAAPPSRLERAERLEQLRALGIGLTIGVARLATAPMAGIDTPDDLTRARQHWDSVTTGGSAR